MWHVAYPISKAAHYHRVHQEDTCKIIVSDKTNYE